jgi:hypothetical protein
VASSTLTPTAVAPNSKTATWADSRWGRWLIPSFLDFFFVALVAWLFLLGSYGWLGLLSDGDAGWHLRTGELILDTHHIPTKDLFSFSKPGETWFAWEWLSDVIYAQLYRVFGGWKGPVLLAGLLIALAPLISLRRSIWLGANSWVALAVALLSVGASTVHFLARPHVFTLVLLAAAIWIIHADLRAQARLIWSLPPIAALWVNLHGGFPILFLCLGLTALGTAIEDIWAGSRDWWRRAMRYLAITLACVLATLLNPFGWGVHLHIVQYLRSDWIRNAVQEFQSPTFRSESSMQFEALLLLGVLSMGFLLRQRRVVESLWILCLAHLALGSVRHIPLYALVAGPTIASVVTEGWLFLVRRSGPQSVTAIFDQVSRDMRASFERLSVWLPVFICVLIWVGEPIAWPKDFPDQRFPVALVAKHGALLRSGRVFTVDQWADYLIYRHYPNQKVFVDGRSDFFGPTLGDEYLHLSQGAKDWRQILDKWRFDVALLDVDWPLVTLLRADREWQVVEEDRKSVLLKRVGEGTGTAGQPVLSK